jgi:hypothetical protein
MRSCRPFVGVFNAPKITKNKTSMRKLWPPKMGKEWGKKGKMENLGMLVTSQPLTNGHHLPHQRDKN